MMLTLMLVELRLLKSYLSVDLQYVGDILYMICSDKENI